MTQTTNLEELAAIRDELTKILQTRVVRDLRAIAQARGLKLRGTLREDIITQLVDFLSQPPNMRAAVAALPPDQRAVLDTLDLLTDAQGPTAQELPAIVRARHGADVAGRLNDILAALSAQVMVYIHLEGYTSSGYRVPQAVRQVLEPLPDLVTPHTGPATTLRIERDDGLTLVSAVYVLARLAEAGALTLRPASTPATPAALSPYVQGWPYIPEELTKLRQHQGGYYGYMRGDESLTVPPPEPLLSDAALAEVQRAAGLDRDRADFLSHVLIAGQLLTVKKDRLQAHSDQVTAFLQRGGTDRLRALYTSWTQVSDWSALLLALRREKQLTLRRQIMYSNFKPANLYQDLARAQATVLRLVNRLSAAQWYGLDAFGDVVRQVAPAFLQSANRAWGGRSPWWLASTRTGKPLDLKNINDWRFGPGAFIQAIFAGPLRWLGLVDLGYDRVGLAAFRLTPLGAHVLGQAAAPASVAQSAGPALTVRPDHVVTVRAEAAAAEVYRILDTAAELESITAHEFRYRLTAASVRRGFEAGLDVADLITFLERGSGAPIPTALRQALADWQAHYGRLHVHSDLTLLELADDFALRELQLSTSLGRSIVRQFSPRLVAIDPASLDALRDEMVRAGHTPKVTETPQ